MASINLAPSSVLRQTSFIMASTNGGVYEFPQVTTTTNAAVVVADILKLGPTNPLVLTKPRTKQHVAAMRKLALEIFKKHPGPMVYRPLLGRAPLAAPAVADIPKVGPTSPLVLAKPRAKQHVAAMRKLALETSEKHADPVIYRTPPGHAPPAAPASEKTREAIRRMALLDIGNRQPYALSLNPHIAEGFLPALVGCTLTITGLEGYGFRRQCQITPANVYFDTYTHMTYITEDLLSPVFRAYLTEPEHDPYRSEDGTKVQVEANIRFSNKDEQLYFPATVIPRSSAPNNFSGVLLGQHGLINRLRYEAIPRLIPNELGLSAGLGDSVWGELRLLSALGLDDELVVF